MFQIEPINNNPKRFIFVASIFIFIFSGILISFTTAFFQSSKELIDFSGFKKQILFHAIGIILFTLIAHIKTSVWKKMAWLLYIFSIITLLLVWVPNFGIRYSGASRWINLHFFSFQPSDFMKLALVLVLARIFSLDRRPLKSLKVFIILGIIYVPSFLILMEPDLGTSFHLLISGISLLFLTQFPFWLFLIKGFFLLPVLYHIIIHESYRFQRIISFLDPYENRYAGGFQLMASYKSFFLGKWFGRDLSDGVLRHTLQARNSDFILASMAEDIGFIGIHLFIVLLAVITCFGFYIIKDISDNFSKLLASGCILLFTWQVIINIAVTMGLIPTTGINLPLVSFGGSSMISYYIILAVAVSTMQKEESLNFS